MREGLVRAPPRDERGIDEELLEAPRALLQEVRALRAELAAG